ncbi:MAG: putative bifunctional diguanylate cyclase/phosphodiesterase [Halocynthiibacter sp.]
MKLINVQPRLQVLLFGAIGLLAAATVYISALISQQRSALEKAAHYDVAFSAGQAANEYFRFSLRIADLGKNVDAASLDEARLRFEILYSRFETLNSGQFLKFIDQVPESKRAIEAFGRMLADIEPMVERLDKPGSVRSVSVRIAELEQGMVALASMANTYGASLVATSQDRLINLHILFSTITAALIATGFLLILLVMWSKRLLRRMHQELLVTADDLTDQSRNLKRQNMLFDAALNNMSQGLTMFGAEGDLIVANRRFGELFDLPQVHAGDGVTVDDIVARCRKGDLAATERLQAMFGRPKAVNDSALAGQFVESLNNDRVVSICQQHIEDGGWLITQEDVTARCRAEERLAFLARSDTLTGLANRNQFCEALRDAIGRLSRNGEPSAVICFNLDRFRNVSTTLGHRYGDLLLQKVADRTLKLVREADVVARFGGDEFAVLLRGVANAERAEAFAAKLVDALTETHDVEGHKVIIGVSTGIALVEPDTADAETAIRNANTALNKAKSSGGNGYRLFEPVMDVGNQARRSLERELWSAYERNEFELVYQPQVNLQDYHIDGIEVLLRWNHPERGVLVSAEFLTVAEDIGLIEPLGAWMLKSALSEVASWPRAVKVAVNLSPVQFLRSDLVATVSSVLDSTGLPAECLELEVVEALFMQENSTTLDLLNQLRDMKIGLTLDHFGTGYSSLSYVRRYPINKIKIDKSYVSEISNDPEALAIVRAVTTLGHALDISTSAEGIKTSEQMRLLHLAGCSEGQGILFSAPLPPAEMANLLREPATMKGKIGG